MTMSATTLADKLKAMTLGSDETAAAEAWSQAFADYFQGVAPPTDSAQSNGIPVAPAAIPAAKAAMKARLITKVTVPTHDGIKVDSAGALQAGIQQFWGALVPATAWPTTTAITPPALLSGLGAALQANFNTNKDTQATPDTARTLIANTIHTNNQGGTATWPSIGPQPIT